jgi:hypothetical protein
MEQRVSLITLGVADLQRSRNYYERLGWKRSNAKAEEIVFFQAGGMGLALIRECRSQKTRTCPPMDRASAESRWRTMPALAKRLTPFSRWRKPQVQSCSSLHRRPFGEDMTGTLLTRMDPYCRRASESAGF